MERETKCCNLECKKIFIQKRSDVLLCPECRKKKAVVQNAQWRADNPEYQVQEHKKRFDEVFSFYGRRCKCCGEDNIDKLQIDHVNNDGYKDVDKKEKRISGNSMYRKIIKLKFPPNYQILCANCNQVKEKKGRCDCQDRFPLLKLCQAVG